MKKNFNTNKKSIEGKLTILCTVFGIINLISIYRLFRENEKPSNDLSTGSVKTSSVDDSALKQILAKEYTHRNRTTVLGAPTKVV
jgi:hypothetical protein